MKETKLQKAFSLFYGTDDLRPAFHNPLIWEDKVYATNAYILIITDKENIDWDFTNENKAPKLDTILPPENISEKLIIPNLEQYKTADELKEIGTDIKCTECGGDGEVEWEYEIWTKYSDCPKCDGDGYESESKFIPTGNKTFRDIKIKLKENYFDIKIFNVLLDVQNLLGGEIELISYDSYKNGTLFKIGVCKILIMKLRPDYIDDWEILTIDTI